MTSEAAAGQNESPGQRLRRVREQLGLRYRDVEAASQQIARQRGRSEFTIGLSRLADIENRETLPSLYRLYSLCVIYGLEFETVLEWFEIYVNEIQLDAGRISTRKAGGQN